MGKSYIKIENSQMASIGIIFCYTDHTKQINPWPNSSASFVVNYNQLSTYPGEMEPLKDHLNTRVHQKQANTKTA